MRLAHHRFARQRLLWSACTIAGGAASSFYSVAQLTAIGSVLAALSLLASHNSTFKKEEPNGGRRVRTSAR